MNKVESPFFAPNHVGKTGGNGSMLLLERFQLGTRGKFFTMKSISHWNSLLREVVDSTILDTFKISLDKVLACLISTVFSVRKVRPDDPCGPC